MSKQKKKKNLIYRIVIIILIGIIVFCLYKIGTVLYEYHEGTQQYEQVKKVAGTEKKDFDGDVDFKSLLKENKDVKAWLYSEDTVINYPVVQGRDNDYYLYRMLNGQWNGKGTLFIDYRCKNPFKDFNTIIYGHRMKDGSMFHSLIKYRETSYYEKHKTMMLITPEKRYNLYIFGVVTIPSDSNKYKLSFASDEEKELYLSWIKKNSEIKTGVHVSSDDSIVMMSTCTYEFDNARLVVYGKLKEIKEDK